MSAQLLLGKPIANAILERVDASAAAFTATHGRPPTLAIVRLGDDPDAAVYTRSLLRACRTHGLRGEDVHASQVDLAGALQLVTVVAGRSDVDGIIIQTPLPAGMRIDQVAAALPVEKDVDGLTAHSAGSLARGQPRFVPATARALLLLAKASGMPLAGARAVVLGRSAVVGLPAALLLLRENATVTICHRGTLDLSGELRRADVLIAAAGQPGIVTGADIKPGAVVLDAGTTMVEGVLKGDVEVASAAEVAGQLTPVPGGVGPVTAAVLLEAVVTAAHDRASGA